MRTSPIHYIAPSAISITPNANGSQHDLAVYVAKDTKIKVYCPALDIGTSETDFQEWTLTGRNRRLGDKTGEVPYTIYARLPKSDKSGGYLVLAPKRKREDVWIDKYSSLTVKGQSVLYTDQGFEVRLTDPDNWYVRLGDVSVPEDGQRTVTLDTGILGTQQWNNEWNLNPDALPLRIELGCTIEDEDVGVNPYVYWGQEVVLTATLTEGWTGTEIQRFDHWSILRKTNHGEAESNWLDREREKTFSSSGELVLKHDRNNDDFNGAVATTFTIMAMQTNPEYESNSNLDPYIVLKSATITIFAETIEKYELSLSDYIASYSPQTGSYSPQGGIDVSIRATDQRGDVFNLTNSEFRTVGLSVRYAAVDAASETTLAFTGADDAQAVATLPVERVFATQKSANVRLVRTVTTVNQETGEQQTVLTELARTTIAFVRDGEDSKVREWIYTRRAAATTFSGATGINAMPSLITLGEINPSGVANGNTRYNNTLDEWVPNGWTDDPQGTDEMSPYEYGAYRDYIREFEEGNGDGGRWGPFSEPKIWSHYGTDGTKTQRRYRTTNSPTYTDVRPTTEDAPVGWSEVGVPTQISITERYRWVIERTSDDGGASWGAWSQPAIDAYLAQDGTSISIKGQAKGVVAWDNEIPTDQEPMNGDIWLYNNNSSDDYDYYEENWTDPGNGTWEGYHADLGDCYLIEGNLWIKVRDTATAAAPRWKNLGRLQGVDGQNAVTVDLDNESEIMLYDGSGNRVSQAATTQATLYDGNSSIASGVKWSISNATGVTLKNNGNATSSAYSGATDCWVDSGGKVTVNGLAASDAEITIRAYYESKYYSSKFTLHKQIGGDKYDLVVSPNAIPYNSTSQEPYQTSVKVSLYKISINGTRELSAPPSGYTLCAVRDNESAPFLTKQASSIAFSVFPAATDANNIRVVVCKLSNDQIVAGTILDSETIPIARTVNGDKGDAAVTYILEPSVTAIPRDHRKTPKTDTLTFVVHKSVGDVQTRLSTQAQWRTEGLTLHYVKDGTEVSVDSEYSSETAPHTGYHDIEGLYDDYDGIITWLVKKNGTVKASVGIGCTSDGAPGGTGSAGHTGRFYYYDGLYSNTKEYRIEESQAPYVKYTETIDGVEQMGFFMLDNGGEEPPYKNWPDDGHPAAPSFTTSTNNPWTQMSSEHQYYIARAFFGENAYLGSFIINGDWMISQYGTLVYQDDTKTDINANNYKTLFNGKVPYAWFDPSDPTASTTPQSGYKFAPSFAVDGLTGATYQNKAIVRGEVYVTGEFKGILKADLVYQATYRIPNNDPNTPYYIDPQIHPYSTFLVGVYQFDMGAFAVLPDATLYEGLELKFFHFPLITRTGNPTIYLKGYTTSYLHYINYMIETENPDDKLAYSAAGYIAIGVGMVVIKAINGGWWVVQGDVTKPSSTYTGW